MATPAQDLKPWEALRECIADGDRGGVDAVLAELPPEETVRVLFRLSSEDQQRLLALMPPDEAADLLHEFPDRLAADLIDHLDTEAAAHIVDELPSDDGADILGSLDRENAEAILGSMDPEAAGEVRELIDYPTDVAGGLMELEHFAYPETIRQRDFIHDVRTRRKEIEQLPARLMLLDQLGRPSGAVHIEDVLLANPDSPLGSVAEPVATLPATADLDTLEDYFDEYETPGAPIVDESDRLVGRVRRQDFQEALAERASSDQLKVQGIVSGAANTRSPLLIWGHNRLFLYFFAAPQPRRSMPCRIMLRVRDG